MKYLVRIQYHAYANEEHLRQHVAELASADVDDVMLFSDSFCCDPAHATLEMVNRRAEWNAYASQAFRGIDLSAGINVITTLGHGPIAGDNSAVELRLQTAVDSHGVANGWLLCPLDEGVRSYAVEKYRLYAAACRPDHIWLDDDLRPVQCFCDNHLAALNKQLGTKYRRQELATELSWDTFPERHRVREAWLDVLCDGYYGLLECIEAAIHEVAPETTIGLMVVSMQALSNGGLRLDEMLRRLSVPGRQAIIRPGCEAWWGDDTWDAVRKAEEMAQMTAASPPGTKSYSEVENHPYNPWQKSADFLQQEVLLYTLVPENQGHTLDLFDNHGNPWASRLFWLDALTELKPQLISLEDAREGTRRIGVCPVAPVDWGRFARPGGNLWFNLVDGALTFAVAGISVGETEGPPYLLFGDTVLALDQSQIREMLSTGAVLDYRAAENLWGLGHGDLLGAKPTGKAVGGVNERLRDEPINGPGSGWIFSVHRSELLQWRRTSMPHRLKPQPYRLESLADGAVLVSELINVYWQVVAPGIVTYENERGGRVAVLPYYLTPWMWNDPVRRDQLRGLLEWAGQEPLPCVVETPGPVYCVCREREDGDELLIGVFSSTRDPLKSVDLVLGRPAPAALQTWCLGRDGAWCQETVPFEARGPQRTVVHLGGLGPLGRAFFRLNTRPGA
jgi:hypothetical protein